MVKKIGILGFILIVVAATGMVWAETYTGAIPAPQPMVMPAAAPACVGAACHRTSQNEGQSGAEDDDRDRRQDAISCAANDALRPTHVWAGWLRSASPHSSGRAYVEVHRALATLCLLPACRIAGR